MCVCDVAVASVDDCLGIDTFVFSGNSRLLLWMMSVSVDECLEIDNGSCQQSSFFDYDVI